MIGLVIVAVIGALAELTPESIAYTRGYEKHGLYRIVCDQGNECDSPCKSIIDKANADETLLLSGQPTFFKDHLEDLANQFSPKGCTYPVYGVSNSSVAFSVTRGDAVAVGDTDAFSFELESMRALSFAKGSVGDILKDLRLMLYYDVDSDFVLPPTESLSYRMFKAAMNLPWSRQCKASEGEPATWYQGKLLDSQVFGSAKNFDVNYYPDIDEGYVEEEEATPPCRRILKMTIQLQEITSSLSSYEFSPLAHLNGLGTNTVCMEVKSNLTKATLASVRIIGVLDAYTITSGSNSELEVKSDLKDTDCYGCRDAGMFWCDGTDKVLKYQSFFNPKWSDDDDEQNMKVFDAHTRCVMWPPYCPSEILRCDDKSEYQSVWDYL